MTKNSVVNKPAITLSGSTVQLFYPQSGETFYFTPEHPAYKDVKKLLTTGEFTVEEARVLHNRNNADSYGLASYTEGRVKLHDGEVTFKGKAVCNSGAKVIKEFDRAGLPVNGLLAFMDRLYNNPSAWAVESAFNFLYQRGMAILDDGSFVGYKVVDPNWTDKYSNTICNKPGSVIPRLDRNEVDDNRQQECSFGYHVGTLEYARHFNRKPGDHMILVRALPEDIVSVPSEGEAQKIRVCHYEVLSEYFDTEQHLARAYNEDFTEAHPELPDEQEWEDEDGWDVDSLNDIYGYEDEDDYDDDYEDEYDDEDEDDEFYDEDAYDEEGEFCGDEPDDIYGVKPDGSSQAGRRYWNVREGGKFTKKA